MGNTGTSFFTDGDRPGDAVAEWHRRVTELATAAEAAVGEHYGRPVGWTYMTGVSNGGYLTRWQLENRPDLYNGAAARRRPQPAHLPVDGPAELPPLPARLPYRAPGDARRGARAGLGVLVTTTSRCTGTRPSAPTGRSAILPGCDTGYDYFSRPSVRDAVRRVELT